MNRVDILRQQRERIMAQLFAEQENRAKLLAALIDIDDEIEELTRGQRRQPIVNTKKSKTA